MWIGNNQPNNPLFYHWVLLQSKIRISDCWARMAATATILAGQCGLGLECQAPNKTHQAWYRCIDCKRGLHALFCCEVTEVNDNQTYHCKHGYGCNKATAGVASHPLECRQDLSDLDDNESIICFSKYKETEDFDATASSSLCNTAGNTDSEKTQSSSNSNERIQRIHVSKTTGRKKVLLCSILKSKTWETANIFKPAMHAVSGGVQRQFRLLDGPNIWL